MQYKGLHVSKCSLIILHFVDPECCVTYTYGALKLLILGDEIAMARPRKNSQNISLEEKAAAIVKQIADLEASVAKNKGKISELKSKLAEIEKAKEEEVLKELLAAVKASGKSVENWIEEIKNFVKE